MESEANQDLDCDLDPSKDDLPLRANTNHMLVRHYVLDLTVCFSSEVISGSVVLFLEPGKGAGLRPDSSSSITDHAPGDEKASGSVGQAGGGGRDRSRTEEAGTFQDASKNVTVEGGGGGGGGNVGGDCCHSDPLPSPMAAERLSWEHRGDDDDFVLVLDCCDLVVSKVEEVHLASIPEMCSLEGGGDSCSGGASTNTLVRKLVSMPSSHWAKQQELYSLCSCAPALPGGGAIQFCTDRWSLQIRKRGFRTPQTFPLALRIWYQTKPQGASVRWTKDQSGRPCVYTQGSPINNRALFPCQEPPVAMSTWQASIHALSDCVVLLSGENKACPVLEETGFSRWDYYVTMPMPASTFTIAIGYWVEAKASPTSSTKTCPNIAMQNVGVALSKPGSLEIMTCTLGGEPGVVQKLCSEMDYSDLTDVTQTLHSEVDCFGLGSDDMNLNSGMNYSGLAKEEQTKHCGVDYSGLSTEEQNSNSGMECSGLADPESCCHSDYPCRFPDTVAQAQSVIPHRVFAPPTLLQRAESMLLPLLPHCLAAAHTTLGVHPFARLDVLIVPPGFSSLGMASPHMVFLSQSVLSGDQSLCGSRLCHEIAHSWFGLAIGARDWTEEWISEGFATYLEDIIWARAQQLSQSEAEEQWRLKASLRWRRLCDELRNSEEELQVLRPNKESTGEVSESGASIVKHALNPEKPFMQVHYLKGYFLLKFLAGKIGEDRFLRFFRLFVSKYHGQLILSQDFLQMLLGTFPDVQRQGLTIEAVYADWLDTPGIPETLQGGIEALVRSSLVEEVKEEVERWIVLGVGTGRGAKRRKVGAKVDPRELTSEQLVLLLELLLEEAELSVTSLRILERTYGLRGRDAEVRHRWCELVVKHKYTAAYGDVERFLLEDQAMGVYLYGELMLNEDGRQQALARHCFSQAREDMDPSARIVVEEMIL